MTEINNMYYIQSVQRTIQVLKCFSVKRKKITLNEFHHLTGFSKSSLQRILGTLVHNGFLVKDEEAKTYQLGMELYFLGLLVEEYSSLWIIAKPIMESIHHKTSESIILNVIRNNKRQCIGHIDSIHQLAHLTYTGHTSPLYAGSSAKSLLAFLPDDEINQLLDQTELEPHTENTITNRDELLKELEKVRNQGYAISNGEYVKGAYSISAPIFNRFSQLVASLSIAIPSVRVEEYNESDIISLIVDGAAAISKKLK